MDKQYERARMAFMFGKFDFAYGVWKEQAARGHADSQASLAWMYQTGLGTKKDLVSAFTLYQEAANQNHPIAQNNLGVLYEKGWGVRKNAELATKWYREAAEWGYSYGQYNYGQALLAGSGTKHNRDEGIYWIELAALQGVKDAQATLAKLTVNAPSPLHQASKALSDKANKRDVQSPERAVTLRRERWVLAQSPRYYTIELMSAATELTVLQYVFHNSIDGTLAYVKHKTTDAQKPLYTLLLGNFSSYQEASQQIKDLPEAAQGSKPIVRRFAEIQELLEK